MANIQQEIWLVAGVRPPFAATVLLRAGGDEEDCKSIELGRGILKTRTIHRLPNTRIMRFISAERPHERT